MRARKCKESHRSEDYRSLRIRAAGLSTEVAHVLGEGEGRAVLKAGLFGDPASYAATGVTDG